MIRIIIAACLAFFITLVLMGCQVKGTEVVQAVSVSTHCVRPERCETTIRILTGTFANRLCKLGNISVDSGVAFNVQVHESSIGYEPYCKL